MSNFTSFKSHGFNFSFKLFVRPSDFEERYKICVITIIGIYMKPWTENPSKPIPKLAEATETNNKRELLLRGEAQHFSMYILGQKENVATLRKDAATRNEE